MSRENHGNSWTRKDEKKLEDMLFEGASYEEMAKALSRSWFACKCRLIKLKLIPFEPQSKKTNVERYDVPLRYVDHRKQQHRESVESLIDFYIKKGFMEMPTVEVEIPDEEDTSRTFSDAELNIVIDYFKTRLAKLAVQKLDTVCFQKGLDISRVEDIFKCEIGRINNMKKMSVEEREKVLTRIA